MNCACVDGLARDETSGRDSGELAEQAAEYHHQLIDAWPTTTTS